MTIEDSEVAEMLDYLDTLRATLADIRQRLKGLPESKLDGENGLAAATMRAADACEEAQRLYAERQHEINLLAEVAIHVRADHWHKASAAVDAYDEWLVSDHLRESTAKAEGR